MGSILSSAFIPPGSLLGCEETPSPHPGMDPDVDCLPPSLSGDWLWGMVQCLTLFFMYGFVLFNASNMLSNGSELLLLVPSLAGVVGSVVLPILGAVPDGAIMLFSGLGPGAQEQLQVGVGTLAGSTIMLLTIPWGTCILAGSVGVRDGVATYGVKKPRKGTLSRNAVLAEKLQGDGLGVTPSPTIASNAKIMLATSLIYLLIQGPAFAYSKTPATEEVDAEIAHVESSWALGGLVIATIAFFVYLVLMVSQSESDVKQDKVTTAIQKEVASKSNHSTLSGLLGPFLVMAAEQAGASGRATLVLDATERKRLSGLLAPFFTKYDVDGDEKIGINELRVLLTDIGEPISRGEAEHWMQKLDPDGSGGIHSTELVDAMLNYIREKTLSDLTGAGGVPDVDDKDEGEGEEDEEVEVPDDLVSLGPQEQQAAILKRSFSLMSVGTALILIFSDPMVEVMSNMGERLSIPPFYISFVLAPLASNASELIASVTYARKKTQKTITVALAALEGAACMNNTFCLAIFMALIYFKELAWKFTAETLAILIVQLIIGPIAMQRTMTTCTAYFVLSLFPLSIVFIAMLESVGYD